MSLARDVRCNYQSVIHVTCVISFIIIIIIRRLLSRTRPPPLDPTRTAEMNVSTHHIVGLSSGSVGSTSIYIALLNLGHLGSKLWLEDSELLSQTLKDLCRSSKDISHCMCVPGFTKFNSLVHCILQVTHWLCTD